MTTPPLFGANMKSRSMLMLILCALLLPLTGCTLLHPTSTPAIFDSSRPMADRIASGERVYTAALKNLTAARKNGLISDDQQREIKAIRQRASLAFDSAHLFSDAGDTNNAQAQLDIIQQSINDLQKYLEKGS